MSIYFLNQPIKRRVLDAHGCQCALTHYIRPDKEGKQLICFVSLFSPNLRVCCCESQALDLQGGCTTREGPSRHTRNNSTGKIPYHLAVLPRFLRLQFLGLPVFLTVSYGGIPVSLAVSYWHHLVSLPVSPSIPGSVT